MDYYVDDCDQPGTPLMLLSSLQINIQNAETRNKVSLAIRKLPAEGEKGNPMVDPRVTLMGHLAPLNTKKVKKRHKQPKKAEKNTESSCGTHVSSHAEQNNKRVGNHYQNGEKGASWAGQPAFFL